MSTLHTHLRYELLTLGVSRPLRFVMLGTILLSIGLTSVLVLASREYMVLSDREYWVLIATQGGSFTWPPLFAYLIAILAVSLWAQDAHGESAYVAYTSFTSRVLFALVRSAVLTLVAALLAAATVAVGIGTATLLFRPPDISGHGQIIAIKAGWMIVCGIGFAHLGAAFCLIFRSSTAALALLLLVPWLVEPLLIQLFDLVSLLEPVSRVTAYLPFTVTSDVVGRTPLDGAFVGGHQLRPRDAALVVLVNTSLALVLVVLRYWRSDGKRDR